MLQLNKSTMINEIAYSIPKSMIDNAISALPKFDDRLILNSPTNRFFYDPWEIKTEFKNSIWNDILDSLPFHKGEARLINLKPETCYTSHADLDDRWHLSLSGERCYLIDLDSSTMHKTDKIGQWYEMNASLRHSAVNFGRYNRIQLVIRKLLEYNVLSNPISVEIKSNQSHGRFVFDDIISPWLNTSSKNKTISNVAHEKDSILFDIEKDNIDELKKLIYNTILELNIL